MPFDLIKDTDTIACNSTLFYGPVSIVGGTSPYTYNWEDASLSFLGALDSLSLGQGFYYLTVTDTFGCSGQDTLEIFYDAPPTAYVTGGGSICDDGETTTEVYFNFDGLLPWDLTYTLTDTNGSVLYKTFNNIDTSKDTISTLDAGSYEIVLAADVNDCIASDSGIANVIVNPLPTPFIIPSEILIYDTDSIELEVGDYQWYAWLKEDEEYDTLFFPTYFVSDSGLYYVWVEDTNGCRNKSDLAVVQLQPHTDLFIPNSFTPNGDEHNELFKVQGIHIKDYYIQIYNRWGELMFESNNIKKSWDGIYNYALVPKGVYYYHIKVLGEDNREVELSGNINVIY